MVDRAEATEFLKTLKSEMRSLVEKHANKASELAIKSDDPHTPIVGCVQMAAAAALWEYLMFSGMKPDQALQAVTDLTSRAMSIWLNTIIKKATQQ